MRMKNRFCRMGKTLLGAVCLLSTCGVTYSCSDDFDLDETKPSFLGASIYDELNNRHNFTTVIRLIDELGYKDVMSQTGSKTLFVANDDAYKEFFATQTSWKTGDGSYVRSYDQLSTNQKRLLLNGSMLNNAYVLEMLTTIQGPVKNLCLRQLSGISATDSVSCFKADELFDNKNQGQLNEEGKVTNQDKMFWDAHRKSGKAMYLAMDKTEPMFTHFLEAQLNEKKITHDDVSFVLGYLKSTDEGYWANDNTENRSYAYDCRIIEPDNVCLNGYFHVLDKVMVTPPNMAEVIRTNGKTNLFSSMLERFSAPYYDATLTEEYKALHDITADSVYQKIYIAQRSSKGAVMLDPDGETLGDFPSLSYDPGWNAYSVNNSTKEQDMAAMFVPTDEAVTEYFVRGAGAMLIQRYGTQPNTAENLQENIFQIPLNIVKPLVANLMKESFNESVPSKYLTIMNDAQDQMFSAETYPTVEAYKTLFDGSILANNGAVYLMNKVIGPATYSSVMAPVLYNEGTQVMNSVIHADDAYVTTNFQNAPLRKFYSTYLLAMQSNFTLFVPTDDGLKKFGMIDPMSLSSSRNANFRLWTMVPEEIKAKDRKCVAVRAEAYKYDMKQPLDQQISGTPKQTCAADIDVDGNEWGRVKKQLLTDMVDQHIIVHETNSEGELGVNTDRKYFVSRSGAPVMIVSGRDKGRNIGMKVDGGMQLVLNSDANEANDFHCTVVDQHDMTRGTNGYGNGTTYFIDRPIQATYNNAYRVMSTTDEMKPFLDACLELDNNTELIQTLFYEEGMEDADWSNEAKKYQIFSNNTDRPTQYDYMTKTYTKLVRFFNNYRYTIFVPTKAALDDAFAHGLKTIDEIKEYVEENTNEEGVLDPDAKKIARTMVLMYANFLKYHFVDQSVFVDNCTATTQCQSACSDDEGNYVSVSVDQTPNAMKVTDAAGRAVAVAGQYNLMARDYELNAAIDAARNIRSSSYVALHNIGQYLCFDAKLKNDFSKAWETPAVAEAYAKKYSLK